MYFQKFYFICGKVSNYSFAKISIKTSDWTSAWRFTLNLYSPFDFILVGNSICSGFISILDEFNNALQISLRGLQGPIGTYNAFDTSLPIEKRIDYFFTKNVKVLSYEHIDDRLENNKHISDHLPVMIEIQWVDFYFVKLLVSSI